MPLLRILSLALVLLLSIESRAAVLFFGGQARIPRTSPGFVHHVGADGTAQVWDDFDITDQSVVVTALFGDHSYLENNPEPQRAEIEIRTGISSGNSGTLIYRDGFAPATGELTGRITGTGEVERRVRVQGLNISLTQGKYWILVRPSWIGTADLLGSGGEGAIGQPILNGNSFYTANTFPPSFFRPTEDAQNGHAWDAPYGVEGYVVPEPLTVVTLAIGAICARRRKPRATIAPNKR